MKSIVLFALVAVAMAGTGYFWHVSDVHLQLDYKEGGDVDNYCHGSGGKAGKWGEHVCNTPWRSVKALAEFMITKSNELGIVPDYVMWTGDIMTGGPEKDHSKTSLNKHLTNWTTLLTKIHDSFNGKTKILPVLGNHDAAPKQHQFTTDTDFYSYTKTFSLWKKFLSEEAQAQYPKGGYYSEILRPGLRFIGYNSGLYYSGNDAITIDKSKDPMGQFAFIKSVLQTAKENGERVMLASHICPGLGTPGSGYSNHKTWSDKLVETMNGYNDIIVGGFHGHDHRDSFQIVRDIDGGEGASVAFRAGSGTPRTNVLPSVTLFKYDTEYPFTLLDKIVFAYDLAKANKNGSPTWYETYRMTKAYNMTDISAASMIDLANRLDDANSAVWKAYFNNIYVQKSGHSCGSSCHKKMACAVKNAYSTYADKCKSL